jgi:transcription termination factor Rho
VSVVQRKELEGSPLADLHAIASELGLEAFRTMRRDDLIAAILDAQGGGGDEAPAGDGGDASAEDEGEAEEAPAEEAAEAPAATAVADEPAAEDEEATEEEPEEPPAEEETASGVLDILPNGSGFIRVGADGQSRDDVYISPAQIRRCELRSGDEVSGPVRPPRRNERHPSLVRVETVNGAPAEPPEERPHFADLTPVFPSERLTAPAALQGVPFGRGSRVAVGGPPGAGATSLLREIAATLADSHPEISVQVALVGVRPEEVTEWRREARVPVTGGGFDRSAEAEAQSAELAVERAKRSVERGGHAALLIDSLEALPSGFQRRLFGAARKTEEGGSLTVIAAVGMAWEPQRWSTTRVMLDPPGPDSRAPKVSEPRSGTLRAELLGD